MSERINLLQWCRDTEQWFDPALLYSESAKAQVMFVRDDIARMVLRASPWEGDGESGAHIIGWHHSKSVRLPVYHIDAAWAEIVIRDNFHDYNVTIRSKVGPLGADTDGLLGEHHGGYLFFQGMGDWVEQPWGGVASEAFSFSVGGAHRLWALLFLFARAGFRQVPKMPVAPPPNTTGDRG